MPTVLGWMPSSSGLLSTGSRNAGAGGSACEDTRVEDTDAAGSGTALWVSGL